MTKQQNRKYIVRAKCAKSRKGQLPRVLNSQYKQTKECSSVFKNCNPKECETVCEKIKKCFCRYLLILKQEIGRLKSKVVKK
jgi:hypothetical protein